MNYHISWLDRVCFGLIAVAFILAAIELHPVAILLLSLLGLHLRVLELEYKLLFMSKKKEN